MALLRQCRRGRKEDVVLSERDHRILEAIEANLTRESPRLARLLSAPPRLQSWQRRSYDVLLLCAVATSLLCLAFARSGLLGAAILTAAVAVAVGLFRNARSRYRWGVLRRIFPRPRTG
jgi:predicted lysophospholipase L1 biosynthesis ABC-type transport system permease subunit